MKKLLLCFLLLTGLAIASGPVSVTLGWDPQAGIDAFNLYASSDLSVPLVTTNSQGVPVPNWPLYATVPGTNFFFITAITPGPRFFFCTASNFWGESLPSNLLTLPPQAINPSHLKASR